MWAARRGRGAGRKMLPVDTRISLQLAHTPVYFIGVTVVSRVRKTYNSTFISDGPN